MQNKNDIEMTKKRLTYQQEMVKKIDEVKAISENIDDIKGKGLLSDLRANISSDIAYFQDGISSVNDAVMADNIVTSAEIGKLNETDDWIYSVIMNLESKIGQLQAAGVAVPTTLLNAYNYLFRKWKEAEDNTKDARGHKGEQESIASLEDDYDFIHGLPMGGGFNGRSHEVQNSSASKRMKKRETLAIRTEDSREADLLQSVGAFLQIPEKTKASLKFKALYSRDENS